MTVCGYARVSTDGQTLAAQDAQLHAAGCAKVYSEKVSGARTDRVELGKLLNEGDVLIVTRLDRLARSTRDLCSPRQAKPVGHPPGGLTPIAIRRWGPPSNLKKVLPRSTLPKSYKLARFALAPKDGVIGLRSCG